MILEIDFEKDVPIYQQIRNQIVRAVATGELAPGDALPSVRTLAGDLGVNMHTVHKAYAVLRDEGYVSMRGRSGACISSQQGKGRVPDIARELSRRALEYRAQGGTAREFEKLAGDAYAKALGGAER